MDVASVKVMLTIGQTAYKHRKKIVVAILSFFLLIIVAVRGIISDPGNTGTAKINDNVKVWQPVVEEYAEKYGIGDYTETILAIMMVESGGNGPDIMQSSESIGLPPNSISDPVQSIKVGVQHLASVIKDAKKKGLDFWTPIQSYNFGSGFNNYVESHGKQYSFDLASGFAKKQANGKKVKYENPIADFNGNWRYAYGNMYYVMLVQEYLSTSSDIGNADASYLGQDKYKKLMSEVQKYNGWPYVWGGSNPNVGFDCSGLVKYNYRLIGYNLPRTAAEQYNATVRISEPKPGDLIFFKGTNSSRPSSAITHVGIYIDKNRMYDASDSGVGYSTWNRGYWKTHFAGFGRVVK